MTSYLLKHCSSPCLESNRDSSEVQAVTQSLYWLHHIGRWAIKIDHRRINLLFWWWLQQAPSKCQFIVPDHTASRPRRQLILGANAIKVQISSFIVPRRYLALVQGPLSWRGPTIQLPFGFLCPCVCPPINSPPLRLQYRCFAYGMIKEKKKKKKKK